MNFIFDTKIEGTNVSCSITAEKDIKSALFCFSLLAPGKILDGGELVERTGGFHKILLSNLCAGQAHKVSLSYADPRMSKTNRAWLPLGAYLKIGKQTFALPLAPLGVIQKEASTFVPFSGLPLIPQPFDWQPEDGFVKATGFSCSHPEFTTVSELAERHRISNFINPEGLKIVLVNDPGFDEESYELKILPDKVKLKAKTDIGIFYAAITLLNLLITTKGKFPIGVLKDHPRFSWRGQHLDCARHFFQVETIIRLLDLMSLVKLNRFHWHFSDDEAFRIEIPSLPELWVKSLYRGEDEIVPGVFGGGTKAGGSYSIRDVQKIVTHAKSLHIEVLPEIEMPAHAFSLTRIYPQTRDPKDTGLEESVQGYDKNVLNPACSETWDIVKKLVTDIVPLFPFNYLHLGCDELPKDSWLGSPMIKQLMEKHNLKTIDDVQGWTMGKVASIVREHGACPAAWEEAIAGKDGGIGTESLIFSWKGQKAGISAARAGYKVVMCPAQNVYLDMAHCSDKEDWGASWAAFISLEETVNWEPVPASITDYQDNVVGVQGNFWGEFTQLDDQLDPMVTPRILGISIKSWEQAQRTSGSDLRSLAGHYRDVFDQFSWNWNRNA